MKHTLNVLSRGKKELKIALLQLSVFDKKEDNVRNAVESIKEANKNGGAEYIILPECFNSPYGALQSIEGVSKYSEVYDESDTLKTISNLAKELQVTITAGSIPTKEDSKYFNTSCTFGPDGLLLGKHQKIHLFDINIPNKIVYEESKFLNGGNSLTMFQIPDTEFIVGIGICFDIRFPELSQIYQRAGCNLLVFPGAFNMTTGPSHWELLTRARAVDNQCYVCVCSPARDDKAGYVAWGHSMLANPWGEKLCEAKENPKILYSLINVDEVNRVRKQLPVVNNKTKKIYSVRKSDDL